MNFQGFVGIRNQLIITANERPLNKKRELHINSRRWRIRRRKTRSVKSAAQSHTTLSVKLLKKLDWKW